MRRPVLALLAALVLLPLLPPAVGDEGWTESRGYVRGVPLLPGPCEAAEPSQGGACFPLGEAHRGRSVQLFVHDATGRPIEGTFDLDGETGVFGYFCGSTPVVEVPADATRLVVQVNPPPLLIATAVTHCWGEVVGPTKGTIVAAFG